MIYRQKSYLHFYCCMINYYRFQVEFSFYQEYNFMIKNLTLLARCNNQTLTMDFNTQSACGLYFKVNEKIENQVRYIQGELQNLGSETLCITRAFIRVMMEPGPYEYYAQSSRWSIENTASWKALDDLGVLLSHKEGRTTGGNTPYLAMRLLGCRQTVSFHLLPVGNWRIRVIPQFYSNTEPPVAVDLGMRDEELAYQLAPGQTWKLPEVIIQQSSTFDEAMPQLHQFIRSNFIKNQAPELPVLFNTWFDRFAKLDLAHLHDALQAAKEVGCETFVIDAGWFGGDTGWSNVGDWREKTTQAFFGRMNDFANTVRAAGLKFGIWMEPERYVPDTPIVKSHPEWFIYTGLENWMRIDLTIPAAREYFKNEIARLFTTYDLRYIKFDMNATLGSDDSGHELNTYQTIFLNILDELKAEYPEVIMENCASGAMRSELTTFKHFDVMFPSDNVNPFTMLKTIQGLWRRYLPGRIIRWSTMREVKDYLAQFSDVNTVITPGEATFEEYERVDLESLLIANFTGGSFSFTGDIASLGPDNRALVKKYIDLYKSRRQFLLDCSGRWLMDTERMQQFQLEKDGNVIVVTAYIASDQVATRKVYPQALNPQAYYQVNNTRRTGEDIMLNGVDIPLICYQQYKWRCHMLILDQE